MASWRPRVWLITGTSSGFGRRLVTAVLARGDRAIATTRSVEKIEDIPNSPNLGLLQLDITSSPGTIKAIVDEAAKRWGTIDVLVNNAGAGPPGILEEGGIQKMIARYEVGVYGPLNVTNAVLPHMRKQRSGTVVIVGSRCAWRPEVRVRFYGSSKAAVQTMGETLAIELAPLNIRVLIVEPGSFRTEGIYANPFDAMNAMVDVVRGEGAAAGREWPLYLVLGKDADIDIRNKCAKMIRHLDEWSDVVRGVDLDDAIRYVYRVGQVPTSAIALVLECTL
ncbi:hypothetical protein PAXRUDRAFT_31063 [Paxillus rubicundulus Ve08.2h10]|uniref:Unplaced genomic scaffold scaffold_64, whole genome shotgun sequence n=1 Tax=Paxillus rubicundulus Ve08.2h10 TaxID=930991 RepID=A0A0D0E394_9AGAM|nr:hypothetical protein PAXRUDRAFT_31063 [Paxillus rubicundulus Ve08.2h10]